MKISSLSWMIVYLGILLIFAFVYNNMPYEFYHTTNKLESYLKKDQINIINEMDEFFKEALYEAHGKQIIGNDSVLFDLNTLEIQYVGINDKEEVVFTLFGWFLNKDSTENSGMTNTYSFLLHDLYEPPDTLLSNNLLVCEIAIVPETEDIRFGPYNSNLNLSVADLFTLGSLNIKRSYKGGVRGIDCGTFYIPKEIALEILAYSNSLEGFPSFSSGNFERMLYLSATTITTLGTGDILPITARARLCVTLEALLGILIIGLYLNSIAQIIKRK